MRYVNLIAYLAWSYDQVIWVMVMKGLSLGLKSSSKYRRSGTNLSETGRQQNQDQTVDRIGLRIGSDRTSIFAFGAEELF